MNQIMQFKFQKTAFLTIMFLTITFLTIMFLTIMFLTIMFLTIMFLTIMFLTIMFLPIMFRVFVSAARKVHYILYIVNMMNDLFELPKHYNIIVLNNIFVLMILIGNIIK